MTFSKTLKAITYLIFLSCLVSSCNNEDDAISTNTVTEEEAVEIVEASLKESTGGVSKTSTTYAEALSTDITMNELCDTLYERSFPYNYNNNFVEADYAFNWSYEITCNGLDIPQTAMFNSNSTGAYNTQRLTSSDSTACNFMITGLQLSNSEYIFNGSFTRNGNQTFMTNRQAGNITSLMNLQITDLSVDKTDYQITGGTAVLTISGQTGQGNTFSYQGTLTFNADGTATLLINGNTYTIDLR